MRDLSCANMTNEIGSDIHAYCARRNSHRGYFNHLLWVQCQR
jgi:hypothetical protein